MEDRLIGHTTDGIDTLEHAAQHAARFEGRRQVGAFVGKGFP